METLALILVSAYVALFILSIAAETAGSFAGGVFLIIMLFVIYMAVYFAEMLF